MMLSCSGQSAVVVSGVTTYQSSRSLCSGRGHGEWLCIRLADWWSGAACPRVWADEGEGEREAAG